MKKLLLGWGMLLVIGACEPEKIGPQQVEPTATGTLQGRQVYLINEGNFQRGNATVSAYTPQSKQLQTRVFSSHNGGTPLGDVFQDMTRVGSYYYLVLNFSGLIRIVDTATWQQTAVIENLGSPRYLAQGGDFVVVSDLFSRQVTLIHSPSQQVRQVLAMPGATGKVTYWQERFAVSTGKKVTLLHAPTGQIDTVIALRQKVVDLAKDARGRLWILTAGSNSGQLIALDTAFAKAKKWSLQSGVPAFMALDSSRQKVYWATDKMVWQQDMREDSLVAKPWLNIADRNIYGLNIDPYRHELYLSDALDFDQNADLYRYDSLGNILDQFKGGALTNGFWFEL